MADYMFLVQMDIPAELEDDFNRIYDTQHVPNILAVPGVHSCTRYRVDSGDIDGVAKYLAIYEIDSPDLPTTDAWTAASNMGDWVAQIRPNSTNRSRVVYKRIT